MPRSSTWPAHHCGVQSRLQFLVRIVWASILFWFCWACCSLWAVAFANGSGPSSSSKRCPFIEPCIARANLLFFCKANSLEAFSDKGVLSFLASHVWKRKAKNAGFLQHLFISWIKKLLQNQPSFFSAGPSPFFSFSEALCIF